jgi:hypothetical protein
MVYTVRQTDAAPALDGDWNRPEWRRAETAEVAHFRPEGSLHRPRTLVRWLCDPHALHGMFRVEDRYVRAVRTAFGDMVCKDSCVEAFLQPSGSPGYINFECNCGGTLLASFITDPTRAPGGFKQFVRLAKADGELIGVYHSLPAVVDPEITTPVTWVVQLRIPFALFERYTGPLGDPLGTTWRGNFYKCGDETSHPHWASWSPVSALNFHLPPCFGEIRFGP